MPKQNFRVTWTRTAETDLETIVDFIADDSVDAALAVLIKIRDRAATLYSFPGKGRVVPELHQHGIVQYRELILSPWRIVYRIDGATVYVIAVFDSRRNLEDLLLERICRT
ncbi:MAG: type II toxin-antitoxin system RelE/ParE family toxin [Desulfuromonadaceae bacterium]|nr:type II toxin-antitoxin system RelE/ParE family toxin [Desulfuromonadaceae bacterium]MDD2856773.1 type II toxin-antitoxin system RelE/ParE family toxin [Desulfuromonadaceae bacterium]